MATKKVTYVSKFKLLDDGKLSITRVKQTATYEFNSRDCTENHLNSTLAEVLETYTLSHVTKEQCSHLRDKAVNGVIVKHEGELYFITFSSITALRHFTSFLNHDTHMCRMDCSGFNPCVNPDGICEKVLNVRCNHIERYSFIRSGFEAFYQHNSEPVCLFYVNECDNFSTEGYTSVSKHKTSV